MANEPKLIRVAIRTKASTDIGGDSDTRSYMGDGNYFDDDDDYFIDENQ